MDLQVIQNKIFEVRGCRVMLDFHLAELYQVETRALKQAVKRNIGRFPSDFMFVLSKEEANLLLSIGVSQNVIPPDYNFGAALPMVAGYEELLKRIEELEASTDAQFNDIYQALTQLLSQSQEQKQRRRIGFVTYDKPETDR